MELTEKHQTPITLKIDWTLQSPADLLTSVGEWLEAMGDYGAAFDYYTAALAVNKQQSLAAFRAGDVALRTNRFEDAAQFFALSLGSSRDHAPTLYKLSQALYSGGKFHEAVEAAKDVLRIDPHHQGARLTYLRSLQALGLWREILALLRDKLTIHGRPLEEGLIHIRALVMEGQRKLAVRLALELPANAVSRFAAYKEIIEDLSRDGRGLEATDEVPTGD